MKRIHLALAGMLSFVAGAAAPTIACEYCPPCDDEVLPLEEGTYDVVDGFLSNGTVEVRADGGVSIRYSDGAAEWEITYETVLRDGE